VDSEWCRQLVAEQLVTVRNRRGFAKLEWQKVRERNEALDCRVYARAAAWILGADRWTEDQWREIERPLHAPPPTVPPPATPARPPPRDGGWVRGRRGGWIGR
jgi:phage terminase large subunit GpA-like protein